MRITHVVRQFHPAIGGMENVVENLASAQRAKGHQVRVVTLDRVFNAAKPYPLPRHEWFNGFEVVRIPYLGSRRYPVALSALRHVGDCDIVHVHGIDFFFDYLAWTAPFHRRKLIVSTHGGFFHTPFASGLKRLYFQLITRLSLSWYSGVAAVSVHDDEMFSRIRTHGRVLIENGVDTAKFQDAGSQLPVKRLVALGRLAGNKRLDRAIRFLAALRRIDPEWTLEIAGRAWDTPVAELRDLADKLGAAGAVRITEAPSDDDISTLMAKSSFLLSTSEYEGFGLTAIEGMSAGLWPVMSDIAPFRMLAKRTGIGTILEFDDADAAARQFLGQWPHIAGQHEKLRRGAIAAARAFEWPRVAEKYEALYRSVLGQDVRTILDVPVQVRTAPEAIWLLDDRFERNKATVVVFANAHTLNRAANPAVRSILDRAIVFNDGLGLDIASRVLFGRAFPENLNGTDFVPHFLRMSRNRYRIFLVGARPGIAERAADRLLQVAPGHEIAGCSHGYVRAEETGALIERIRRSRADILLVAMGNPQQEQWLSDHLAASGCRLGFGVGGLFDFLAGTVPRAPAWVQAARLEWSYRLLQEPRRLWRRYLVEMPLFLARILRQWLAGARVSRVRLP
ncbi:MAG TPA: WecB/TagA/CpsF family glycosyltransferase [Pseudolabrys sp.]|nr:WecB/TagA/CpsF family glycosyltransferase [Pseudolabrys sp.]